MPGRFPRPHPKQPGLCREPPGPQTPWRQRQATVLFARADRVPLRRLAGPDGELDLGVMVKILDEVPPGGRALEQARSRRRNASSSIEPEQ